MSHGVFGERATRPTEIEVETALGGAAPLWTELVSFVEGSFPVRSDWKFYGKNYGWALAFKKSGKALVSLYPGAGSFRAQLILRDDQIARVPDTLMILELRAAIDGANPYAEGRWIFLAVVSERELEVVKRLIEIRAG
ncbi:MAG: DUF3788 family protein [Gaiellaceae bacterium]|jgi:hypothetical protein